MVVVHHKTLTAQNAVHRILNRKEWRENLPEGMKTILTPNKVCVSQVYKP